MADASTIGVSCGHRVPRVPVLVDRRKLYWCVECGAHRMSGGKSSGEHGHDWAHQLRELVALEDESGRPIVLTVAAPLHPASQRLMDSLGVEVRVVSQVVGARNMGSFVVDGERQPFVENLIDFRHSLVQAAKRADANDETLEICPHCMCEVDVDPQPHRPGCAGIGKPRATSAPVLAKLAEEDSSSERAVDPEPEEGPRSPTPDAGGLDEQQPPMGARTAEATDATGEPGPRPAPDGASSQWDRDSIIAAIVAWNDAHGVPPTSIDWARIGDDRPNAAKAKQVFGSWADAVEAAGFPRPRRGVKPALLAEAATPEPISRDEAVPPLAVPARERPVTSPKATEAVGVNGAPRDSIGELRATVLAAVNAMFDVLEKAETVAAGR